jgi:Ca-activated chloride channel family protein
MSPTRLNGSGARRRRLAGAGVILAAAAGLGAQSQTGQNDPYRVASDVVSVYATVTGRDGQVVRDLAADDFQLTDNGRRQPIAVFSGAPQPVTVVVMLDCSGSMAASADRARRGAREFVSRLRPADRARIGNFGRHIRITPEAFTSDRDALHTVLDHDLQDSGGSPVWTAVDRSITALRSERGHRIVLLFSDGHDDPDVGQVVTDVKDVIHRTRYNGIMVYAIAFPRTDGPGILTPRGNGLFKPARPDVEVIKPHQALKELAAESGGGYFEPGPLDPLDKTFARIADELHQQYWLGFKADKLDGRTHAIGVTVRRPNVTVRARKSYVADPRR